MRIAARTQGRRKRERGRVLTGGPHLCYNYSKVEEITNARVEVMTPKKWRVHSMALTRPFLKGMGLTEEQVSAIIEAHTETIDGLKSDRDKYKSDAAKLVDVQKELDGYKNGEDWQKKYNDLDKAFKDYKADVANQEKSRQIKSAYTKLLESANIDSKRIGAILKVTDFTNMKGGVRQADGKHQVRLVRIRNHNRNQGSQG